MSNELRTLGGNALASSDQGLTREQIDLIKDTICNDATDSELKLFVETCDRTGLDPFARQIFAVKRWDSKLGRNVMGIQVSIDGFRLNSERSGKYRGQLGPYWTGDGVEWLEVWLSKTPPAAAKVGILHRDFLQPLWGVATWDQYVQTTKEGKPNSMWSKMGPLMLGKCAESLARRTAFPQELSGLYTSEEMGQADNEVEQAVVIHSTSRPAALPPAEEPAREDLPKPTGWSIEEQETFHAGMEALYIVFRSMGRAEAWPDESEKWTKRKNEKPASEILPMLEKRIADGQSAAARMKPVEPVPSPVDKPISEQVNSNWFLLREKWEKEGPITETQRQTRNKKLIKEWTEGLDPKSDGWMAAVLVGQVAELAR